MQLGLIKSVHGRNKVTERKNITLTHIHGKGRIYHLYCKRPQGKCIAGVLNPNPGELPSSRLQFQPSSNQNDQQLDIKIWETVQRDGFKSAFCIRLYHTNTLVQWFSNFLHQVPPQKIFVSPSIAIMTNVKKSCRPNYSDSLFTALCLQVKIED